MYFQQLAFDDGVLDRYGLTTTKYQAGDFYGNREQHFCVAKLKIGKLSH